MVSGRWVFRAACAGGMPGTPPGRVGASVEYAGIDVFRVESGRIAGYRLCADIPVMLRQVGAIPS